MNRLFNDSAGELRWGWKAAVVIVGTVAFGIILSSLLVTALTVAYASQGLAQQQALARANDTAASFEAQILLSVLQLGFLVWLVRWLVRKTENQRFDWSELGLKRVPDRSALLLLGALLAVLLNLTTTGIGLTSGTLNYLGNGFELFSPIQVLTTVLLGMLLAFASGFGEEVVFRGYLQSRIAQRSHPLTAVFIVAVLFGLSHPVVDAENPLLYLLTATLVGLLFSMTFLRTGSLWMGIALHTVWNYLQIAIVAVRNGADERFFGHSLFVFDNLASAPYMLIELGAITIVLLILLWLTRSGRKWMPVATS